MPKFLTAVKLLKGSFPLHSLLSAQQLLCEPTNSADTAQTGCEVEATPLNSVLNKREHSIPPIKQKAATVVLFMAYANN